MPILGMFTVFAAVLTPRIAANLQLQIIIVLIGVLMIEAGVLKFTNPFLPSERRYEALREEVDHFIALVRDLNGAAVELRATAAIDRQEEVERILLTMHRSVDLMGELAGRQEDIYDVPTTLSAAALEISERGVDPDGYDPGFGPPTPRYRV
jgi:hypothetical protein